MTQTSALVTWRTNREASSWVTVNRKTYGNGDLATSHAVTIDGLQPGTAYTASITSDRFGTLFDSKDVPILTLAQPSSPTLTITDAKAEQVTATSAAITWRTNRDSIAWVTVAGKTVNDASNTAAHFVRVEGLEPGKTYKADIVSERNGTSATSQVTFTTPTEPLRLSDITISTSDVLAVITWTTNVATDSFVVLNGDWFGDKNPTRQHRVEIVPLEPGKGYSAVIRSVGGGTLKETPITFAMKPGLRISAAKAEQVTSTSAAITWLTNRDSIAWVTVAGKTVHDASNTAAHFVRVDGLEPGKTYKADIVSERNGTSATSQVTFTTPAEPLRLSTIAISTSDVLAVITWTTNVATDSTVVLNGGWFGDKNPTRQHRVEIVPLVPGLGYSGVIRSVGGGTLKETPITFAMKPGLSISAAKAEQVTSTSAVFTWRTNQDSIAWVTVAGKTVHDASSTAAHFVRVDGLEPGKTYKADIISERNGKSATAQVTFSTPAAASKSTVTVTSDFTTVTIGQPVAVTARANGTGIQRVDLVLQVNGRVQQIGTQSGTVGQFVWSPSSPGGYQLTARAINAQGEVLATSPIFITVLSTPTSVAQTISWLQSRTVRELALRGTDGNMLKGTWVDGAGWSISSDQIRVFWRDVHWYVSNQAIVFWNRDPGDESLVETSVYPIRQMTCPLAPSAPCDTKMISADDAKRATAVASSMGQSDSKFLRPIPIASLISAFNARHTAVEVGAGNAVLRLITQYPVVVVHGIWSSEEKAFGTFERITPSWGFTVFGRDFGWWRMTSPSTIAGNVRDEIQKALDNTSSPKVTILAHSKGGLVVRYMLAAYPELGRKVDKVITLDTPHRPYRARMGELGFSPTDLIVLLKAEATPQWRQRFEKLGTPQNNSNWTNTIDEYAGMSNMPLNPGYLSNMTWVEFSASNHDPFDWSGFGNNFGALDFPAGNGCSRARQTYGNNSGHSETHELPTLLVVKDDLRSWDSGCAQGPANWAWRSFDILNINSPSPSIRRR